MNELEEYLYVGINGEEFFVAENGIDYLIKHFPGSIFHVSGRLDNRERCICLALNANDLFWWRYADYEIFTFKDVEAIYLSSKEKHGIDKWICKKRKMRPQHPIENVWRQDGSWDAELESFPVRDNTG